MLELILTYFSVLSTMEVLKDQYGYDDNLFISETQEYVHCVVCTLVLRDPIQILCCGHKFCTVCFERIKTHAMRNNTDILCPIDREVVDLNEVRPDVAVERIVGNLLVKCPEHDNGCDWTGDLRVLEDHIFKCQYDLRKQPNSTSASLPSCYVKNIQGSSPQCKSCSCRDEEIVSLKYDQQQLKDEVQIMKQQLQQQAVTQKQLEQILREKNAGLECELSQIKRNSEQQRLTIEELCAKIDILQKKASWDNHTLPSQGVGASDKVISTVVNKEQIISQTKKSILVHHHCGLPTQVTISNNDHNVRFHVVWTTVSAPTAVVPSHARVWFEIQCTHSDGWIRVGWSTTELPISEAFVSEYAGSGTHSFGFDPVTACKHHNGDAYWGRKFTGKAGFLGVALDLVEGDVLYSVDGQWTAPMGVAFAGIPVGIKLFPVITGVNSTIRFNFGDQEFMYGPPDSSFRKLYDVV